jgi:hypothetical protein
MTGGAQYCHNTGEGQDSLLGSGTEFRPVSYMLFGREEMNATSRERPIFCPLFQWDINITANCIRALAFDIAVTHYDAHWLTAVQTWGIDLYRFARKGPADRQGFKTSLCKPFLLPVNCDAVLRRQIVEWCKRDYQVRTGI